MTTSFQAFVLGLVQGLTEFLPISSSAHLALTPWFLGWQDPGLAFDVALHFGTLIALLWYFRTEWARLGRAAFSLLRTGGKPSTAEQHRVIFLVIATMPGAAAGYLLQHKAEDSFRSPTLIAVALVLMGALLWFVDRRAPRLRALGDIRYRDALLIGLAQMVALIPGVSRSGSTITAGRALALTRETAAIFSFLMSMPITAAAVVLKVPHVLRDDGLSVPLLVGVASAAISSWLAIAVLLRFVSRYSYGIFALYRLVVGLAVLAFLYLRPGM
jgi:undecaprenyl-diphosphatase